jgi:hypothetical protein
MTGPTENTRLIAAALDYVVELYRELSEENGAPSLGTQNQAVDFVLANPDLTRSVAEWARQAASGEATPASPRRLPIDETYRRVADFLRRGMGIPVFERNDRS